MPRPTKCRRVCAVPRAGVFGPQDVPPAGGAVALTVDEYEAIRLIDLERMTQEQCAAQMGVARTTVQAVYESARGKLADALVNVRLLVIGGGSYRVCPHAAGCRRGDGPGGCRRGHCRRLDAPQPEQDNTERKHEPCKKLQ